MQFRQSRRLIPIDIRPKGESKGTFIPAVRNRDLHTDIFFLLQHFRNIIGLHLNPVMVAGPARREIIAASLFPIYVNLIQAKGRCIDPRFFYISFYGNVPEKYRACLLLLRESGGDPVRLHPLWMEQPGLKSPLYHCLISLVIPYTDRHLIIGFRHELISGILHQHGPVTFCFSGIPDSSTCLFVHHLNLVCFLHTSLPVRIQFPGKSWSFHI